MSEELSYLEGDSVWREGSDYATAGFPPEIDDLAGSVV